MGPAGDMRAWDAKLIGAGVRIGVEAETRLVDAQALTRRLALKRRDGDVDHVILLVADTRGNRAVLRAFADALAADFPVPGARALAALTAGRDPEGSAILLMLRSSGPSSRRPRTQAARTMSGWARKMRRLIRTDGSSAIPPGRRPAGRQRCGQRRVDDDACRPPCRPRATRSTRQAERPRTVERAQPEPVQRVEIGRGSSPERPPRALGVGADPHDGEDRRVRARPTRPSPARPSAPPRDTARAASRPTPMNRFDAGQCATRVPVSTSRAISPVGQVDRVGEDASARRARRPGRRRRRSPAPPGTAGAPRRSRPDPRRRATATTPRSSAASAADSRSSSAVHETANRGVTA